MVILHGDMRTALATLEPDTLDACVTDPPYELGFMGKSWDRSGVAFDPETWAAVYRVLKPGAHLLAFGGTRTVHRIAVAIEDAGFEIRDQIAWMFGSGFPKSLDVSKAIDKVNGETDRLHRFTAWMRTTGLTAKQINDATDTFMGSHYLTDKSQPAIPTPELWAKLRPLCGDVPAWVDQLVERIAAEREVVGAQRAPDAKKVRPHFAGSTYGGDSSMTTIDITAPATDLARQWDGWGTALKPAHEPIIVARKPLVGTVAANVTTYGTGAINVDACRIGTGERDDYGRSANCVDGTRSGSRALAYGMADQSAAAHTLGRWPANVALDEDAARLLDEMSGERKSNNGAGVWATGKQGYEGGFGPCSSPVYGDTGGASRFFYVAKASRRERNAGLDGMPERKHRPLGLSNWDGQTNGSGETMGPSAPQQNHHPTVKPIALMRWLVRLVTPPGGTVLDPFTGSGTTGIACALEGFGFLGCELNADYVEIAERRIAHWSREREPDALPLFAGMAAD